MPLSLYFVLYLIIINLLRKNNKKIMHGKKKMIDFPVKLSENLQ